MACGKACLVTAQLVHSRAQRVDYLSHQAAEGANLFRYLLMQWLIQQLQ
jgi:hypothetical protein